MILAVTLAQEAEEHNPLIPEINELIYGTLAFLIVFVVLFKFAFPRIAQALEERRQKIQGELETAERTRTEADEVLERYRQQLAGAREESNRIIEEARKTAESMRRDMAEKAEREAEQMVARARQEIRGERDRAFSELKRNMGELSVELASRVVGQALDKDRQVRLVDEYIEELSRTGGDAGGNGGGSAPKGGRG